MNIAMFTNVYKPFVGGVPVSIDRLSRGLLEMGHNVYIFAPEYPKTPQNDLENGTIRCKLITFYSNNKIDMPVVNIYDKEIKKHFYDLNIDLVHVHHPFWMGKLGVNLAKAKGIPCVFTYHTRYEEYLHHLPMGDFFKSKSNVIKNEEDGVFVFKNYLKYKFIPKGINKFIKKCNGVIFPTESMRQWVGKIDNDNQYILPTGIEEEAFEVDKKTSSYIRNRYIGTKKYLFITVSRISKEKNIEFIVKSCKVLKQKMGDCFKIMIIGSGDLMEDLNNVAIKFGVEDNIVMLGSINNKELKNYYAASDAFVFASKTETQGIVLIEAMAQNIPVVAVDATGVCDIVVNGENGYISKENKNNWCNCIIKLLNEKQNMGNKPIETARKFTVSNVAIKADEIYKDIVKKMEDDYE